MLEKTLKSPLDCKENKPDNPKGKQSWIFIGRTDAETEDRILWPPNTKSWLIGKDSNAGKDWGQEEKRVTEDEIVGWHHWHNGHKFVKPQKIVKDTEAWHAAIHGVTVRYDLVTIQWRTTYMKGEIDNTTTGGKFYTMFLTMERDHPDCKSIKAQ